MSTSTLKYAFSVILVATLLTIYEVSLFYLVVSPGITSNINSSIDNVSQYIKSSWKKYINDNVINLDSNLYSTYSVYSVYKPRIFEKIETVTKSVIDTTGDVLDTLNEREESLIDKINNYTIFTSIFLILFLLVLLWIIKAKLKNNLDFCTWNTSIITIILILSFQILFYYYGKNYKYIGTEGNEEMMYYLINAL